MPRFARATQRLGALVASLLLVSLFAGNAQADPKEAFQQAAQTMAAGRYAAAADQFEDLGREHPGHGLADDALGKAAQLRETRLGQIARAIELYELVLERYPRARVARRASTRLAVLRRQRGSSPAHAEALSKLSVLLSGYADRPRHETVAGMRAIVDSAPDSPAAARARMWLGTAYLQDGQLSEARRWYQLVQQLTTDSGTRVRARKAEGDAYLAGADFDDARAAYRELYSSADPLHHRWADVALAKLERAEHRASVARWAWLVIVAFLIAMIGVGRRAAGGWRAALRGWVRPPGELYFLLPIALLLGAASMRSNVLASRAIIMVFSGALLVTWLSGSTLELARTHGRGVTWLRAGGHAAAAAATVVALCYLALMNDRLLDLLAETWTHGHD